MPDIRSILESIDHASDEAILASIARAQRQKARQSTLGFAEYINRKYRAGRPHREIAAKLDMVIRGEIDRLMVFAPPRHGKSELGSRMLPARYLGIYPDRHIISAAFDVNLATDFGRDVRNIVASPAYHDIFPSVTLAEDKRAQGHWVTSHGGSYLSGGIGLGAGGGSGITGRGAHLLTIDDPHKDRSSAESAAIREHVWSWYTSTAYTRLAAKSAVVLIQTRWHEDDLAGRLMAQEAVGGDHWEKVELSAIDDHGEIQAVWPEEFPVERLRRIQMNSGGPNSRDWIALYGQRPAPQEGALFKIEKINILPACPTGTAVRAWDLAATRETGTRDPSWTVGLKLLRTAEGLFVVVDVVRFRGGPEDVEKAIITIAKHDGYATKISIPQDPGQAGKAQVLSLTQKLFGFDVVSSPETGDKATRAAPIIAQANVGNLALVKGPWNHDFLEELAVFPNGTHEDQVDALSRASSLFIEPSDAEMYAKLGAMGPHEGFDAIGREY